jgi:RNA polymerase sigma factor (sigma-70 family)
MRAVDEETGAGAENSRAGPRGNKSAPSPVLWSGTRIARTGDIGGIVTDEAARRRFEAVAMPYLDDAYRLARWLTRSGTDAEDVVQDAFLRAFAAIGGYAGGNPRAWVLTIVRRTAYSWMAKNRPALLVVTDDLEAVERAQTAPGEGCGATPESLLIAAQDGERLSRAIEALSPPFREALVLRDVQGLSYREIAEVMEIPIGTVMSRLARARGVLVKALGEG